MFCIRSFWSLGLEEIWKHQNFKVKISLNRQGCDPNCENDYCGQLNMYDQFVERCLWWDEVSVDQDHQLMHVAFAQYFTNINAKEAKLDIDNLFAITDQSKFDMWKSFTSWHHALKWHHHSLTIIQLDEEEPIRVVSPGNTFLVEEVDSLPPDSKTLPSSSPSLGVVRHKLSCLSGA